MINVLEYTEKEKKSLNFDIPTDIQIKKIIKLRRRSAMMTVEALYNCYDEGTGCTDCACILDAGGDCG